MMKPLQGALCCKFRDHIVGVVLMQDPGPGKVKGPKVIKKMKLNKKNNVKKKKSQGKATESWSSIGSNERPQECVGTMQFSNGHISVNLWN